MIQKVFRARFTDTRTETIWLTIYADLITNLALVFLCLFGLTMMGEKAMRDAILSMQLGEIDVEEILSEKTNLESVSLSVRQEFQNDSDIFIKETTGSARIAFGENILFNSGSATPKGAVKDIVKRLAPQLKKVKYTIVVEGHTDGVPLKPGGLYKNNWELSLARSMALVRLLISEGGLNADHIAAAAYGEVRPVASNLTALGRRANRRIEIALLENFPYGQ